MAAEQAVSDEIVRIAVNPSPVAREACAIYQSFVEKKKRSFRALLRDQGLRLGLLTACGVPTLNLITKATLVNMDNFHDILPSLIRDVRSVKEFIDLKCLKIGTMDTHIVCEYIHSHGFATSAFYSGEICPAKYRDPES